MKQLIVLLITHLSICCVQADNASLYNGTCSNVMASLYNFEFTKADSLIRANSGRLPPEVSNYLLINYNWWLLVTTDDSKYAKSGTSNYINGFAALSQSKYPHTEKEFLRLGFMAYKIRFLLYRWQFWDAYTETTGICTSIYPTLKDTASQPLWLMQGLFNYFAAYGHSKYSFIFSDDCFETASKQKGISYLERCTRINNMAISTEAFYFLMKIYLELEKKPEKALPYSQGLIKSYPNNIVFQYYYLNILLNLSRFEQARNQYANIKNRIEANKELSKAQKQHLINITQKIYKEQL